MKRFTLLFAAMIGCCAFLSAQDTAPASTAMQFEKISDYINGTHTGASAVIKQPDFSDINILRQGQSEGDSRGGEQILAYYNDRALFEAQSCSNESTDFENINQNFPTSCFSPLNNTSDNCYAAGALIDGFSARTFTQEPGEVVVLPSGLGFGNPSTGVLPSYFNDYWEITFPDNDVYAVGFDFYDQYNDWLGDAGDAGGIYIFRAFTIGDTHLGGYFVQGNFGSQFVGLVSTDGDPITRIEFLSYDPVEQQLGIGIELIDNLTLGRDCNPCENDTEKPTISCGGLNMDAYIYSGNCYALVELNIPEADDNCAVTQLQRRYREVDEDNNNISGWTTWKDATFNSVYLVEGRYKVQWRARDAAGNAKKCRYYVDVMDVDNVPCPWQDFHIDCEGDSSYDEETESFIINSDGCANGITEDYDQYAFTFQELCGNSDITVEVTDISGTGNGWAGVQMRETGNTNARMVSLMTNKSSNHRKEVRTTFGGTVLSQLSPSFNRHWLRLVRVGNSFRGYTSSNGTSWFLKFSQTVVMEECIAVGMVVNGYVGNSNITATFENVEATYEGRRGEQPGTTFPLATVNKMEVFPNPSNGLVNVYFEETLEQEGALDILNTNGAVVYSSSQTFEGEASQQIDLSTQPNGIYLIRLRLEDGTEEIQRVVLQR